MEKGVRRVDGRTDQATKMLDSIAVTRTFALPAVFA